MGNWSAWLLICLILPACNRTPARPPVLHVFAAASLVDALPQAIESVSDSLPPCRVVYNFASSATLARQILAGSPADLFFSANQEWMNRLVQKRIVVSDSVVPLLGNRLIVVTSVQRKLTLHALEDLLLPEIRFIAMGDPEHVPAGRYARWALEKAGLWQRLAPKAVYGQDVRAALYFVQRGEADVGVVYKTDALISPEVKEIYRLPDRYQPEIRYVLAPTRSASEIAKKLMQLLMTDRAAAVFKRYGFTFTAADHFRDGGVSGW